MKVGCCIGIGCYEQVLHAGYRSITLPGVELSAMDEAVFEKNLKKVTSGPLDVYSINSFCPPSLRLTGADFNRQALEDYAGRLFSRAARLGVRYVGVGSPASRSTRPGEDPAAALEELKNSLAILCRLGESCGLTILLESVCTLECNLITYTQEAARLVRTLNLPNLGLVYDIYHAHMMGEDPRYILEAGDLIHAVHIAQNEGGKRCYLREENMTEYLPYVEALYEAGYDGELNLEAFFGDIAQELPRSKAILDRALTTARQHAV